jgi:hypothetical protein
MECEIRFLVSGRILRLRPIVLSDTTPDLLEKVDRAFSFVIIFVLKIKSSPRQGAAGARLVRGLMPPGPYSLGGGVRLLRPSTLSKRVCRAAWLSK